MLTGHQQLVAGQAYPSRRGSASHALDLDAALLAALAGVQVEAPTLGVNIGYPPAIGPEQPDYVFDGDPLAVGRFEVQVGSGLHSGPPDPAQRPSLDRGQGL